MLKDKIRYAMIMFIVFLSIAMIIQDTGSGMISLLILMPASVLILAFFYGCIIGFDYMIPIITMIAFLPIVYGFLNESALIYVIVYGGISLVANFVGGLFGRWIHHEK